MFFKNNFNVTPNIQIEVISKKAKKKKIRNNVEDFGPPRTSNIQQFIIQTLSWYFCMIRSSNIL